MEIRKVKKKQVYFFLGSIILIYFVVFHENCDDDLSNKMILINILKSTMISFIISLVMHIYQGKEE